MLEIKLIGAVEALRDGAHLAVTGRRLRALLALLALSPDETVPIDTLGAGIWDDDPPGRLRGSLQTAVSRLRRVRSYVLAELGITALPKVDDAELVSLIDKVSDESGDRGRRPAAPHAGQEGPHREVR